MEELILNLYEVIKDYRDDSPDNEMSVQRIERWIGQFEETDREFILSELKIIFDKQYISKSKMELFIEEKLTQYLTEFKYDSMKNLLNDTVFLDLQDKNKSQSALIDIVKRVLKEKYNYDFKDCGSNSHKFYIYLDDILCTGNTLFYDIKEWLSQTDNNTNTHLELLESKQATLLFVYYFIHKKNYHKKIKQFEYSLNKDLPNFRVACEQFVESNNLLIPIELSQIAAEYKEKIEIQVQNDCETKKIKLGDEEYIYTLNNTTLFSSLENRNRLQDIFLKKGIEILNEANVHIPNMRSLGYSLPTQRNFGFGTLCFSWRNVPNNTPLVFWYSNKYFFPLFEKQ